MKAEETSPIPSCMESHRTADAPPDLSNRPTQSSTRAMELIRQRRSTVVRRITDISALGPPHEERERGGLRNVCAAKEGAENVTSGAIFDFRCFAARTNSR
ncbi:phosphatidylinositol 3-related kinase [Trypanosoma cruzi]|nr:phosphatidylinositol 3-related kinase [Trypanosoma cruzi]